MKKTYIGILAIVILGLLLSGCQKPVQQEQKEQKCLVKPEINQHRQEINELVSQFLPMSSKTSPQERSTLLSDLQGVIFTMAKRDPINSQNCLSPKFNYRNLGDRNLEIIKEVDDYKFGGLTTTEIENGRTLMGELLNKITEMRNQAEIYR